MDFWSLTMYLEGKHPWWILSFFFSSTWLLRTFWNGRNGFTAVFDRFFDRFRKRIIYNHVFVLNNSQNHNVVETIFAAFAKVCSLFTVLLTVDSSAKCRHRVRVHVVSLQLQLRIPACLVTPTPRFVCWRRERWQKTPAENLGTMRAEKHPHVPRKSQEIPGQQLKTCFTDYSSVLTTFSFIINLLGYIILLDAY